MTDSEQLLKDLEQRGITKAKIGGFDVDGVLRGKYVSLDKFWQRSQRASAFATSSSAGTSPTCSTTTRKVTGWHTGYPDAHAVLDLSTLRVIPWEPDAAAFLVDFATGRRPPHPACPRSLLQQCHRRARRTHGLRAELLGASSSSSCFKETPRVAPSRRVPRSDAALARACSATRGCARGRTPSSATPSSTGWRPSTSTIEALHTETGPGVYEAAIRYDEALRAADKAALFKTAMKQIASRHGLAVTFMAKWNADLPGSSGHLHQCLWQRRQERVLGDARRAERALPRRCASTSAGRSR